jgi:flagellar basal-body rod protein FlgF
MDIVSSIAASRMVAQQRAMDVTAANIANANTPGFKAERMLFSDWLSRQRGAGGDRGIAYTQDRGQARSPIPAIHSISRSPATATSPSTRRAGRV